MGNYPRTRLSEETLRQIYFWARDEIGFRVPLTGQIGKGEAGATGVTYTLAVKNGGLAGKGASAEGTTQTLQNPAAAQGGGGAGARHPGRPPDRKAQAHPPGRELRRSA